jgi:hypothetical protein
MGFQDFKGNMRPQNKRSRGRGGHGGGGGGGNPNNPNRPRGPHRQQTFDSNGPGVKIRGNAYQVFERYIAMAREAASTGDRVAAENLYQHAEHYYRIMTANGEGFPNQPRATTPADTEMGMGEPGDEGPGQGQPYEGHGQQQPGMEGQGQRPPFEGQGGQGGPPNAYEEQPQGGQPPPRYEGGQGGQGRQNRYEGRRQRGQHNPQNQPQHGYDESQPHFDQAPTEGQPERQPEPPRDPGSEPQPA